jgi:hypothetical protein
VDGKDYFADLLLVLRAAEEEILITDWSMSPEIFLERETGDPDARLDRCLIERAKAGVKVVSMMSFLSDWIGRACALSFFAFSDWSCEFVVFVQLDWSCMRFCFLIGHACALSCLRFLIGHACALSFLSNWIGHACAFVF